MADRSPKGFGPVVKSASRRGYGGCAPSERPCNRTARRRLAPDESSNHYCGRRKRCCTERLPQGLDESKIEAGFDNGLLTVHVPKAALPQPKKIQINTGSNRQGRVEPGDGSTR
ncbi:MAG: Hsp20/alpha crystallin family protein [Gemmatimonadaceae bacterium]